MPRKSWIFLVIIIYALFFFISTMSNFRGNTQTTDKTLMTDVSGLMPVKIKGVVNGQEEKTLVQLIREAKEKDLKISIAGQRHSMGGHTFYPDAIMLNMTSYNQILEFDKENKTIRVQSGATWDELQRYINSHGLAVKVMQSQNIFTIGGSLSVNAHGRDIRFGSLIDTVNSFRLLTAEGNIITVSRTENAELFPLVIGGYGLFGIILDVELSLTDDEFYLMRNHAIAYDKYSDYFIKHVKDNPNVRMHLARISTASNDFLTDMYLTDYMIADSLSDYRELKEERLTWLTKFLLGLSRQYDLGRNWFWDTQKKYFLSQDQSYITRNNAMRSESKFLEYESENNTDVLQEYFVPIENFQAYIDALRDVLNKEELNLLNITIRYVSKNEEAVLSYAKEDMFALVLLINQGFLETDIEQTEKVIRKMIDVTLDHGGSYYLPYMSYPTKEQMKKAYPLTDYFFQKKREYDSSELFMNLFYERYHTNEPL